jgi:hypothetical protein
MKSRRTIVIVVSMLTGLLVSSSLMISSHAQQSRSRENPGRRLSSTREVPAFGVVLEPPAQRENPRITESQALELAKPLARGMETDGTVIDKTFAVFTSNHVTPVVDSPSGPHQKAPLFQKIPSWVVTFSHVCVPVYGISTTDAREGACAGEELNVVINADTGELLEAYSDR